MVVTLPWYPKQLSPNAREHWATVAKHKKQYRHACWALAKEAGLTWTIDGKILIEIIFYPPSKRAYDLDNCLAAIKSGLDGVADAMGVNDRRFDLRPRMADTIGGMIKLTIEDKYENLYVGLHNVNDGHGGC